MCVQVSEINECKKEHGSGGVSGPVPLSSCFSPGKQVEKARERKLVGKISSWHRDERKTLLHEPDVVHITLKSFTIMMDVIL